MTETIEEKDYKVYFASPLFNEMEKDFNEKVVSDLEINLAHSYAKVEFYLPQRNMAINDKNAFADSLAIAKGDNEEFLSSDILVAVLDGVTIDAGVASEIGIAWAKGMHIIGLYTDSRRLGTENQLKIDALQNDVAENQFHYLNLYTVGLVKDSGMIVTSVEELFNQINFLAGGLDETCGENSYTYFPSNMLND